MEKSFIDEQLQHDSAEHCPNDLKLKQIAHISRNNHFHQMDLVTQWVPNLT